MWRSTSRRKSKRHLYGERSRSALTRSRADQQQHRQHPDRPTPQQQRDAWARLLARTTHREDTTP